MLNEENLENTEKQKKTPTKNAVVKSNQILVYILLIYFLCLCIFLPQNDVMLLSSPNDMSSISM